MKSNYLVKLSLKVSLVSIRPSEIMVKPNSQQYVQLWYLIGSQCEFLGGFLRKAYRQTYIQYLANS
jgi:hypothetical protein